MITNNNILLIGYGNSYLKVWIVNTKTDKVVFKGVFSAKASFIDFKNKIDKSQFTTSLWACTNGSSYAKNFISSFKKTFSRVKNIFLTQSMLIDKVNIDKKAKEQVIGIDILLLLYYYANKQWSCLVLSLGTVYFALVVIKKQLKNVLFVPNLTYGLSLIPKLTSIPSKDIPTVYDKTIGLNTKDCFAAGCYHSLNGFIESIKKQYSCNLKVNITGGDGNKYPVLVKKYGYDQDAMLKALLFFYHNNY